jgi:hypothetical protein
MAAAQTLYIAQHGRQRYKDHQLPMVQLSCGHSVWISDVLLVHPLYPDQALTMQSSDMVFAAHPGVHSAVTTGLACIQWAPACAAAHQRPGRWLCTSRYRCVICVVCIEGDPPVWHSCLLPGKCFLSYSLIRQAPQEAT